MELKKGITADIFIEEENVDIISEVIFTFNKNGFSKKYPEEVSYSENNFCISLTQEDTNNLFLGENKLEAQYIYTNNSVNKSEIYKFNVIDTLATKMVE